jgi:ribonuclease D
MIKHPKLLASAEEIRDLAAKLSTEKVIAFDTEFIRENTFYPIVEIIQVATATESWLVDAADFKKGHRAGHAGGYVPAIQPLLDVFADKNILKIVHAAQGDQECLYTSFGVVATPTFDTSVGASLCGYGDSVGLGRLLKIILDVTIGKGHARTNWSVRPLPPQLLEYAHADVEYLVSLGEALMAQLDQLGRKAWSLELSAKWEEISLYSMDVEGLARKLGRSGKLDKRGFAALVELVRWREERVRHLNLPRRWVADDAVLMDLATVKPKDVAHLASFRGLNKGELAKSGQAILDALARGAQAADSVVPPRSQRLEPPTAEESQVLELIKCYVGILADRNRIAAKHLMTTDQLLALIRRKIETPDDLVTHEILSPAAAQLVGQELINFLAGKRSLYIIGPASGKSLRIEVAEVK